MMHKKFLLHEHLLPHLDVLLIVYTYSYSSIKLNYCGRNTCDNIFWHLALLFNLVSIECDTRIIAIFPLFDTISGSTFAFYFKLGLSIDDFFSATIFL